MDLRKTVGPPREAFLRKTVGPPEAFLRKAVGPPREALSQQVVARRVEERPWETAERAALVRAAGIR